LLVHSPFVFWLDNYCVVAFCLIGLWVHRIILSYSEMFVPLSHARQFVPAVKWRMTIGVGVVFLPLTLPVSQVSVLGSQTVETFIG
jgi:hypothetical protein